VQRSFNYQILDEVAHRPWPMPGTPWIMTQTWHDLLFAHWRVDAALLASKIPAPLQLDLFEQQAWLGVVPFRMTNVSPRGVPALPWISAFPELNVRTYVRVGGKPGVFFFSLDATNPLAVRVARWMFRLPYFQASMTIEAQGEGIHYRSRRAASASNGAAAELIASYRPTGPVFHAREGSLDYFLTERYCLYTVDARARAYIVEIHHPRWPLQTADANLAVNTMADAAGMRLPDEAPLLRFAKRQDTVAWPLTRI
jgi:uncharacterized protein YqjF (DUF2071 family)